MTTNLVMATIGRLLQSLDYLRIYHPQKRIYDWWFPLGLALVSSVVLFVLPAPVQITGRDGLIAIFTGLLQILTGFYIASLAAVATFDRASMDQPMPGIPPTLNVKSRGISETEHLTRRRFLCLLFGYLSLLSFFLYFFGAFADLLRVNLLAVIPATVLPFAKWTGLFLYLLGASNLMTSTLLGLYYMTERIHRDEPVLIKKSKETSKDNSTVQVR